MSAVHYGISGRAAREIARSVEAGIREGALLPGILLPTVRALADELGVANGTVAAAYRLLRDQGLVASAGRLGTRVLARPTLAARSDDALPVPEGALDLSTGQPDPALLPPLGPALAHLATGPAAAPSHVQLPQLLDLGRKRFAADGLPTENLTLAGGALDGIERVLAAHLRTGDSVAVEDPGWPNLLDLLAGLGLRAVPVAIDQDGPQPAALSQALVTGVRAAVLTSRAHNPTGATITRARAHDLRTILAEYPATVVIEDDHAGDLAGLPLAPIVGVTEHWAFVRSVSKAYGPDLRFALIAADPTTVARVEGRRRLGTGWVSTLLQQLVVELWQDPDTTAVITRAAQTYDTRRATLQRQLADHGIHSTGRSGLNLWVPVSDETTVVSRLLLAGYVVAPGARFRIRSRPGIRITLGGLLDSSPLADALADTQHTNQPGRPT